MHDGSVKSFNFSFFKVGQVVRRKQSVWRTSESKMRTRTRMTVEDPKRRWVKRVVWGGTRNIEQCDGDGDRGGGLGGDGDDDSMQDDEDEDEVLEEDNGWGQEEEEDQEEEE